MHLQVADIRNMVMIVSSTEPDTCEYFKENYQKHP